MRRSSLASGAAAVVVGLCLTFALVAMVVYGVSERIANSKNIEARRALPAIGLEVARAHQSSGEFGSRLCRSASKPVPEDVARIRGRKYQSRLEEWNVDQEAGAGFACLRYAMTTPQYYQYAYEVTGSDFVVRARGDLDGDGVLSNFELHGRDEGDRISIEPRLHEAYTRE